MRAGENGPRPGPAAPSASRGWDGEFQACAGRDAPAPCTSPDYRSALLKTVVFSVPTRIEACLVPDITPSLIQHVFTGVEKKLGVSASRRSKSTLRCKLISVIKACA